jgi:hypothetical protein
MTVPHDEETMTSGLLHLATFISGNRDVGYWHFSDMTFAQSDVCFRGKTGSRADIVKVT